MVQVTGNITVNVVPDFVTRQRQASTLDNPDALRRSGYMKKDFNDVSTVWNLPVEELMGLVETESVEVHTTIAHLPHTPADVLDKLARSRVQKVKRAVATNHNSSPETLRYLAQSSADTVRWYVTMNPVTPADVLDSLADDKDAHVRRGVATHENTSPETVMRLVVSNDEEVVEAIANNAYNPVDVWVKLLQHDHIKIRYAAFMTVAVDEDEGKFLTVAEQVLGDSVEVHGLPHDWVVKVLGEHIIY